MDEYSFIGFSGLSILSSHDAKALDTLITRHRSGGFGTFDFHFDFHPTCTSGRSLVCKRVSWSLARRTPCNFTIHGIGNGLFLASSSQLCSDGWAIPGCIAFFATKAAFLRQSECSSCSCLSPCHPLPRYYKGEVNFHKVCLVLSWESLSVYITSTLIVFSVYELKWRARYLPLEGAFCRLAMSGRCAEPRIFACSWTEQS